MELAFKLAADPTEEPGLFRKGITICGNWVRHTMRAGIQASGDGLVIQDNVITDQTNKQWWINPFGVAPPVENVTYENRAIDWSGWHILIQGNHYEVYRHQLGASQTKSVDGEGILIQECCGGTTINQAVITKNVGNSYIGLYKTLHIQHVRIAHNELTANVTNTALIFVSVDTNAQTNAMDNVVIEDNLLKGNITAIASEGGQGNVIRNNTSQSDSKIKYSCHVKVTRNTGFELQPCLGLKRALLRFGSTYT